MRSVRGRLPTLATLLLRWKIPTSTLKSRNPLKDIAHILSILKNTCSSRTPVSFGEVEWALKKLKQNKYVDCLDLTSEHLTYGGASVVHYLKDMINLMFDCKLVPSILKEYL